MLVNVHYPALPVIACFMMANHAQNTSRDKGQTVQAAAAIKVRAMFHQQDIETEAMQLNTPLWGELNDHTRGAQQ